MLLIKFIAPGVLGEDNSCLISALAPIWALVVQWFVVIVRDAFLPVLQKNVISLH